MPPSRCRPVFTVCDVHVYRVIGPDHLPIPCWYCLDWRDARRGSGASRFDVRALPDKYWEPRAALCRACFCWFPPSPLCPTCGEPFDLAAFRTRTDPGEHEFVIAEVVCAGLNPVEECRR